MKLFEIEKKKYKMLLFFLVNKNYNKKDNLWGELCDYQTISVSFLMHTRKLINKKYLFIH